VTNRHVTPAAAKFYGVGWRLVKRAGKSNPIDAGIALAMALRVLSHEKENRPPTMAWSSTHPFTSPPLPGLTGGRTARTTKDVSPVSVGGLAG